MEGDAQVAAAAAVLRTATRWVKESANVTRPEDLIEIADEVVKWELGL